MNNTPTPETDAIVRNAATADHPPTRLAATLTVKCEKLERERAEAREALRAVLELANDIPDESLDDWKIRFHKVLEEAK
jgi:hypothetical protein